MRVFLDLATIEQIEAFVKFAKAFELPWDVIAAADRVPRMASDTPLKLGQGKPHKGATMAAWTAIERAIASEPRPRSELVALVMRHAKAKKNAAGYHVANWVKRGYLAIA